MARLKFSISLENFKILNFFNLWVGGLGGENPAFPQARPIFQQPFSLPENAQTLAGIAFLAAGKSVKNCPAASKFAGKLFQQGISDSHSLLEFSEFQPTKANKRPIRESVHRKRPDSSGVVERESGILHRVRCIASNIWRRSKGGGRKWHWRKSS